LTVEFNEVFDPGRFITEEVDAAFFVNVLWIVGVLDLMGDKDTLFNEFTEVAEGLLQAVLKLESTLALTAFISGVCLKDGEVTGDEPEDLDKPIEVVLFVTDDLLLKFESTLALTAFISGVCLKDGDDAELETLDKPIEVLFVVDNLLKFESTLALTVFICGVCLKDGEVTGDDGILEALDKPTEVLFIV